MRITGDGSIWHMYCIGGDILLKTVATAFQNFSSFLDLYMICRFYFNILLHCYCSLHIVVKFEQVLTEKKCDTILNENAVIDFSNICIGKY